MDSKLEKLERTVLEMGTEVYVLRDEIDKLQKTQKKSWQIVVGIKEVLDQKGIINRDEFDLLIEATNLDEVRRKYGVNVKENDRQARLKKPIH